MTTTINASTSSGLIVTSDTSGTLALQSNGSTIASVGTSGMTINSYVAGASMLTNGTAVASTSGTSIDFTSIPSWVKRITVMFTGVSTNGTSAFLVQLGTSSGAESTGYDSVSSIAIAGAPMSVFTSTAGFYVFTNNASYADTGSIVISKLNNNLYVANGQFSNSTANPYVTWSSGNKTMASTLDRVRITTVNGTDTFDAGSINIQYE